MAKAKKTTAAGLPMAERVQLAKAGYEWARSHPAFAAIDLKGWPSDKIGGAAAQALVAAAGREDLARAAWDKSAEALILGAQDPSPEALRQVSDWICGAAMAAELGEMTGLRVKQEIGKAIFALIHEDMMAKGAALMALSMEDAGRDAKFGALVESFEIAPSAQAAPARRPASL